MGLLTLYNVLSPLTAEQCHQRLNELVEPLGLTVSETFEREDSSQLVLLEKAESEMHLGVAIVPLIEGQFQPAPFDVAGESDPSWVASVRAVCKVGALECPVPALVAQEGLRLAAELVDGARIYDLHALIALEADQARALWQEPFKIRSYVNYHYVAPPDGAAEHSWLHLHGMMKFFRPDLEAFDVHPDVSHKALALLMHLATELAQGKVIEPGEEHPYGHGAFTVRPSEEVRAQLQHFTAEAFEDELPGPTLVVEDAGSYRSLDKLLRGAYELEPKTRAECDAEQRVWQERIEGIQKAWVRLGGELMVRVGLEVGRHRSIEHIWASIEGWDDSNVVGSLLNDAFGDLSLVRGTQVTFDQGLISGVSVMQNEEPLDEVASLRVVDQVAAELLDSAITPSEEDMKVQDCLSPEGAVNARFLDDGQVGALHLVSSQDGTPICDPIWVYNRRPAPPIIDMRRLDTLGTSPLLSEVYTSQRSPAEVPDDPAIELFWDGSRARLSLDGELWAVGDTTERCGWSKLIVLANRFGRPLHELDIGERLETIRALGPLSSKE